MVTRAQKAKGAASKGRTASPSLPPPISGYTFVDEKWRCQTVDPLRCCSRGPDGSLRPSRPANAVAMGVPELTPRTLAERAAEKDIQLWARCSSFDEYEVQRQSLSEHASHARRVFLESQPAFHQFPKLPIELRNQIWASAMAEVTQVSITCSGYTPPRRSNGWCGTVAYGRPRIYAATAMLPPLLLVNRESHAAAVKQYRRIFRGVHGGGGVLAAYPTVLTVEMSILSLVKENDFEYVREIIFDFRHSSGSKETDEERMRHIARNQNLKKFEMRFRNWHSWDHIFQMHSSIRAVHELQRETQPDWVAPGCEIVLEADGKKDNVVYSFEGGLHDMPDLPRHR